MANQYKDDPRQALFLKAYLDPKSETFSNAYQSAMVAGYEHEYAKTILSKDLDWLAESVRKYDVERIVAKAQSNLHDLLDDADPRVRADITKFVSKSKGGWVEKSELEHTGEVVVRLGKDS